MATPASEGNKRSRTVKKTGTRAASTLEVPTYFVTTVATMGFRKKGICRIAFGESAGGETKFRVAVAMTEATAKSLARAITEFFKEESTSDEGSDE